MDQDQRKTDGGKEKPIPLRTADLMTERVTTFAVGAVVARLLSNDANKIAAISDDVGATLISVSSLLRVVADAMKAPATEQYSTTEDKIETIWAAASLVDVCQVATDAACQTRYMGGKEK